MPRLAIVLRFAFVVIVASLSACAPPGGFRITPVPADQTLRYRVVDQESAWISDKIALIDIDGVLTNAEDRGMFGSGEHPVSLIVEKLNAAALDPSIKAIVLRINSPGGTVTASDILYQEIVRWKARTKRPVVAVMLDVAASGGYYVACAADEIWAHPTTITGSIGVLMQTLSVAGTMEKIGVTADAIVSGKMKDAGSPLRAMKPDERRHFQVIVDSLYERFLETVLAGRPKLSREQLATLADGRVYTAAQARENGLIDAVGGVRDAVAAARKRAGLARANTVLFTRPVGWKNSLYAQAPHEPSGDVSINLVQIAGYGVFTNTPRFLYLWRLQ